MKTSATTLAGTAPGTSQRGRRPAPPDSSGRPVWWRRVAVFCLALLVGGYALAVTAGYGWLHYGRNFDQVGFMQVALFRVQDIRRAMAAQQFVQAKAEWDARNYQAAYVYFTSAVARDPENIPGRLAAARFFAAMGAANLEVNLLEEGLARTPNDRQLNQDLFGLLLATGRERHALELLHGRFAPGLSGPNGAMLQTCELQATLATSGGPAAKIVLDRHPGLRTDPLAVAVVARVLWETSDRPQAIQMLGAFLQAQPNDYNEYVQLATWQQEAGLGKESVQTALKACAQFPKEPAARVLLLGLAAPEVVGSPFWKQQVALYLRDFASRPDAIVRLAELSGRKGWVDLAHTLYEIGAVRQPDLGVLALCYGDALGNQRRWSELHELLAQLDAQAVAGGNAFLVQLRHRQVLTAAALGEPDNVREYARRLAALVRGDPDALEQYRLRYVKLGLPEAAAQFAITAVKPKVAVK